MEKGNVEVSVHIGIGESTLELKQECALGSSSDINNAFKECIKSLYREVNDSPRLNKRIEANEKWIEMQALDLITGEEVKNRVERRINSLRAYLIKYSDVINKDRMETIRYLIETYKEIKFCTTCKLTKETTNE